LSSDGQSALLAVQELVPAVAEAMQLNLKTSAVHLGALRRTIGSALSTSNRSIRSR